MRRGQICAEVRYEHAHAACPDHGFKVLRFLFHAVQEDEQLRQLVAEHGAGKWNNIAQHFPPHRNAKSCRLRWGTPQA
jgi:hypothetical protein